jgi:hypothetical protein
MTTPHALEALRYACDTAKRTGKAQAILLRRDGKLEVKARDRVADYETVAEVVR